MPERSLGGLQRVIRQLLLQLRLLRLHQFRLANNDISAQEAAAEMA
jgi:hypothetical protein